MVMSVRWGDNVTPLSFVARTPDSNSNPSTLLSEVIGTTTQLIEVIDEKVQEAVTAV
jgi:hypothetical protein